jgi:hypothetical protein
LGAGKTRSQKILENRAESPPATARGVSPLFAYQILRSEGKSYAMIIQKVTDQSKADSRNSTTLFPIPLALYIAVSAFLKRISAVSPSAGYIAIPILGLT